MTNEEFMRHAQLQKASAARMRWANIKDTIQAALLIMALVVGGLVFLALCAFSFLVDFGTIAVAPTTIIIFLLVWIAIQMDKS